MAKPFEDRLPDMDNVFGFAPHTREEPGSRIYIFYRRVEELVRKRKLQEHKARILGLALAHELGHLLLPFDSHSSSGIMKAKWNRQDFQIAARGHLGFTSQQGEFLRTEVAKQLQR